VATGPKIACKLKGKWTPLLKALKDTTLSAKLEAEVGRATELNAREAAKVVRDTIKESVDPKGADLTTTIKRSKKPLVDRGDLWKAVTAQKVDWKTGFAGLLRTARLPGGSAFNLGMTLHEGATIKVTPKMRRLFQALANATNPTRAKSGKGAGAAAAKLKGRALDLYNRNPKARWKPLNDDTTAIVIPGRPFLRRAIEDPDLKATVEKNWSDAVQRAIEVD
jgi:hypothetical protein